MPAQYDLTPREHPAIQAPLPSYKGSYGHPRIANPTYHYLVFPDYREEGYTEGYNDGYTAGYDRGYDDGYDAGYTAGLGDCPPPEGVPKITSQNVVSNGDGTITVHATADKPGYLAVLIEVSGRYKTVYTDYYPETSWHLVLPEPKFPEYRVHLLLVPPEKEELTLEI